MAGIENEVIAGRGFRLSPSTTDEINRMRRNADDVAKINYEGNPEGVISANPSSLCHDPVSGNIYFKQTGTGNTGWLLLATGEGILSITPDENADGSPATAIEGSAGNMNLFGQKAGGTPVVDVLNSDGTLTGNALVEDRTWSTQFIVDNNTAPGTRATFTNFQDAVDQAIVDAVPNVLIQARTNGGTGFSGDFDTTGLTNVLLQSLGQTIIEPNPTDIANISGDVTVVGGTSCQIQGFRFLSGVGGTYDSSNVEFDNCTFDNGALHSFTNCQTNFSHCVGNGQFQVDAGAIYSTFGKNISYSLTNLAALFTKFSNVENVVLAHSSLLSQYCSRIAVTSDVDSTVDISFSKIGPLSGVMGSALISSVDMLEGAVGNYVNFDNIKLRPFLMGNVFKTKSVSGDYTVAIDDGIVIGQTGSSGPYTITLPQVTNAIDGQMFIIQDLAGTADVGNITVTSLSGINNQTNAVINTAYGSLTVRASSLGGTYYTIGQSSLTANSKVTTYTIMDSPATWTKDPRTQRVEVFAVGGGGGGGSGRKGTTALSSGGGGGAAGPSFYLSGPAQFFGATETVIVGAGGVGGASQAVDATDGNAGGASNTSAFGQNVTTPAQNDASGGTTISGQQGVARGSLTLTGGGTGNSTSGTGQVGAGTNAGLITRSQQYSGSGGGGGGGANIVTQRAAGNGGDNENSAGVLVLAGGVGGLESTGIDGANGNDGIAASGIMTGGTGGGGGGGYSVGAGGATAGGNGGNGGFPGGGGGGGGGGISGVANSGAGGNGGDGVVYVIEYF